MFFKKGQLVKFTNERLRRYDNDPITYHKAIFSVVDPRPYPYTKDAAIIIKAENEVAKRICRRSGNLVLIMCPLDFRLINGIEQVTHKIKTLSKIL